MEPDTFVQRARELVDAVARWCRWKGPARIVSSFAVGAVVVCAMWLLVRSPAPSLESRIENVATSGNPSVIADGPQLVSSTTVNVIVVHVAGSVKHPGLVFLANGSRANDALIAAGGFASTADIDSVNLAMLMHDGDQFFVPSRATRRSNPVPSQRVTKQPSQGGAGTGASNGVDASGVVNINTASATDLDSLPGVGPSTAKAIVDYRTTHGPFTSVDGLLGVRGIGEAKLDVMRSRIRV